MTTNKHERPADYFADWKEREALAEGMIPQVGKLYREKNVKTYLYGFSLHNQSVLDITKAHRKVRLVEGNELSEFETAPVLDALNALDLAPAHVTCRMVYLNDCITRYFTKTTSKTEI